MILKAEGYDPGPDASISAATGERPQGEKLTATFQGKTISFGARLKEGPYTLRFEPDGRLTSPHWDPALGSPSETEAWTVAEERLCIIGVRRRCYIPVVNGERIELFDRYGVMQIDAVALPQ